MDSIAAILAQVQAYSGGGQATQPQPQAPIPAPPSIPDSSQPNLLAILSTLNAANQQQQAPQPQPVAPTPPAAPAVQDLSQLWIQLAQQQQQQPQPQPQTLADLIGTLTGQQKPATPNPLGYAGFSTAAQMNPAAVWSQYAAWTAAASQNTTPVNAPDTTSTGEEPRLSGKDIRERLREQVGWTEPLYDEESNNPSSSGRDGHGRDGNAGGGKNWKKDKQWKKSKKNKNNKFGGGGGGSGGSGGCGDQHQGENGGGANGGGGGGARNNMCKYYSKGQCQMGNSCKFSHPEDAAGDGGAKQGGGGGGGGRGGWKEKKRGGHGGHGGHGGGHHGPRGGNLDAEAGRSEWVEGLEY